MRELKPDGRVVTARLSEILRTPMRHKLSKGGYESKAVHFGILDTYWTQNSAVELSN